MARKIKYQWSAKDDESEDNWVSRSQRKRESTALQDMGEELCALSDGNLKKMELPADIYAAVLEWKRINDHEGRRRQMQFVGRLMREDADAGTIRARLDSLSEGHAEDSMRLKQVERQRERLLAADSSQLAELCAVYGAKADAVRDLAEKAKAEVAAERPPHSSRALFRLLRELTSA